MTKPLQPDVLTYDLGGGKKRQSKVKRHYRKWCFDNGVPEACVMPECPLNTPNATWRGAPITLILDHKDGNKDNSHPQNLQWVCPNCESQLPTHGGRNVGRIQNRKSDSYAFVNDAGGLGATVFLKGVTVDTVAGSVGAEQGPPKEPKQSP